MTEVHVVVPEGIDDPERPSGGNRYDREVIRGLAALGWTVREHPVAADELYTALRTMADGAIVLVDGLVASGAPAALVAASARLRSVALVHMPLGDAPERAVLDAARAVITTSRWSRERLIELHALPADKVRVAVPGVAPASLARGSGQGGALLSVAAVTALKGHDVLMAALEQVADLDWRCTCVGSLDRDPGFADRVQRSAPDRVRFTGPRTGPELQELYATADLAVLPSRTEAFGMVVTEALARGVPVLATAVGGVPEALGRCPDGITPGVLVAPADADALAAALRRWLADGAFRSPLRRAARERRATLPPWSATTSVVAQVLAEVAA